MDWSDLPPLSTLRAFEAAARLGGFSAAGRELNVTHAAVAQQVRALEGRLGVALMRREGRGLALTPETFAASRSASAKVSPSSAKVSRSWSATSPSAPCR